MCGINGILNFDGEPVKIEQINLMNKLLQHRGPDDQGEFFHKSVGLGHRRLSIIDLSSKGHQPFFSNDGNLVIIYNGEIYNFIELRGELIKLGYDFRSRTDTEVLLTAYQEWGKDCLTRLNGMFAFAIYNLKTDEIFLSRDYFGIKPLYYYLDRRRLVFSSEIKPIIKVVGGCTHNEQRIYEFIMFELLDHTQDTCFAEIKQIPPAHYAICSRKGNFKVERYWDLENMPDLISSEEDLIKRFKVYFYRSVRYQLRSDVTLGTLLSGGLDSSAIVCAVKEVEPELPLHTLSAVYDNRYYDESPYIKSVVNTNDNIQAHYVYPQVEEFASILPEMINHLEDPFGGTSMYATYKVFELAKAHKVKVALFGQGGDEQLLGYRKFLFFYLKELLNERKWLPFISQVLSLICAPSIWYTSDFRSGLRYLDKKFNPVNKLLHQKLHLKYCGGENVLSAGDLQSRIKADLFQLSVPVLLRYGDRLSMAHSVEARVPFLDHDLVQFLYNVPTNLKIRGSTTKYIMRQALKDILPTKVYHRKTKLGFATPERDWFRSNMSHNFKTTIDKAEFLPNFMDMKHTRRLINDFLQNPWTIVSSDFIFRIYISEKWAKHFNLRG